MSESALKDQIGGDHYKKLPIQPIEYAEAGNFNQCHSLILKYLSRYPSKGGLQDLEKSLHCLDLWEELYDKPVQRLMGLDYAEANGFSMQLAAIFMKLEMIDNHIRLLKSCAEPELVKPDIARLMQQAREDIYRLIEKFKRETGNKDIYIYEMLNAPLDGTHVILIDSDGFLYNAHFCVPRNDDLEKACWRNMKGEKIYENAEPRIVEWFKPAPQVIRDLIAPHEAHVQWVEFVDKAFAQGYTIHKYRDGKQYTQLNINPSTKR